MRLKFSNPQVEDVFCQYDYSDFSKLMFDTAVSKLDGISTKEANEKIKEIMFSVLGLDEKSNKKEIRKAIRRHKIDIYEVIEETVENLLVTGWGENPFFNRFVDVKNLSDGDSNEFTVDDDGVLIVSALSGNHHDLLRQKVWAGQSVNIPMVWYGVGVYAEFEDFLTGKIDWAKFIFKIYEALDRHVGNLVYSAILGSSTKMPNASRLNKTGALVKETVLALVEDVEAATGEKVVIMGTKAALSALDTLVPTNWISEDMKNSRNGLGRLAIWEGVELIEIPQRLGSKDLNDKLVNNKTLLFMGSGENKFIKVCNGGEGRVREVSSGDTNLDATIEYEYQQKIGVGVVFNKTYGMWTMP